MARKLGTYKLTEECQLEHYVDAFKEASTRVRYIIITQTVASVLIFVGFNNSLQYSWFDARLETARAAADVLGPDTTDLNTVLSQLQAVVIEQTPKQEIEDSAQPAPATSYSVELGSNLHFPPVGKPSERAMTREKGLERQRHLEEVRGRAEAWIESKGFETRSEVEDVIRIMEQARTENILLMRIPILGAAFDINDLGMFSGISLAIFLIILSFALSRYHEDQYLSLWKVHQILNVENRPGDGDSAANLVYHSLAMAQLFSKPPSLARYRGGFSKILFRIILLIPISIQTLIFLHDVNTVGIGRMFSGRHVSFSISAQLFCLVVSAGFTFACVSYARSSDKRWSRTFYQINPHLKGVEQPSWWEWVGWKNSGDKYKKMLEEQYEKLHAAGAAQPEPAVKPDK